VTGSMMKLLVIAVALVSGIVLIASGFDGAATQAPLVQPTTTPPTTTPPPDTPPPEQPRCVRRGVVVVFNGTQVTGLAAAAGLRFEAAGYNVPEGEEGIRNATTSYDTSEVLFRRRADRTEAECLVDRFMPSGTVVARLTNATGLPDNIRLAVYLGDDYAEENPIEG
jgi:LytR cell envelope-related transcriptional attenuator